jgi:tetratricopeptide (TPR) repeat protein/tRNA A-37 threonylcarbamoyl transferase component Bud32
MGTIYLAENIEIEKQVAIKALHPHLVRKPKVAEVFRREARASARIGAPNIIEVIDFLSLEDGRLLYVMEHLDGEALVRYVDEAPMAIERLVPILRQVCKGLHAAHRSGIIHRDIKPENIMLVTRDRRADFVKVVDFGIAALQSEADANHKRAGTPHYIAPEQIQRRAFDGRADMYALACTAYEMITGRTPFESESVRELLEHHLHTEPLPPSELVGSEAIPAAIEAVLMRCLAKEPEDRFADMADLEAALCEAQIIDGIITNRDDLALPDDIDGERRARILAEMPRDPMKSRPKWLLPAMVGAALLTGGIATYAVVGGVDPQLLVQQNEVDDLTNAARAAGARAQWVFPPIDQPEAKTALDFVKELELLEGGVREEATNRALELRKEFAQALARQGDRYLEMEGGRPFAYEFYHQAVMFDPLNQRVREVGGFSGSVTAMLLADAERGEFSIDQLQRAEITRALAIEDPDLRATALAQAHDRMRDATVSLETTSAVATIMRGMDVPVPPPKGYAEVDTEDEDSGGVAGDDSAGDDSAGDVEAPPASADDPKRPAGSSKSSGDTRDRPKAKRLAAEAKSAQKSGNNKAAERLYHKALAADRYNSTALSGLGDIYFDRGNYSQSVTYRKRAVRVARSSASRHLALGDAYFKVLRYQEALGAYEQARKLGSKSASARIKKVKARL